MKIDLVSYKYSDDTHRVKITASIINKSKSDLILFPGYTLWYGKDVDKLASSINNKYVSALFEVENIGSEKVGNCLYLVQNGTVQSLFTNQLFATSSEINNNAELGSRLIHEMETRRAFRIGNKRCLVIQCGELNILKNLQSQGNKVVFRLSDDEQLQAKWDELVVASDIILNPMHSPMGNQGKMKKRREYLSSDGRAYFSVSNTRPESDKLSLKGLQYAVQNQMPLEPIAVLEEELYIVRTFEI